jgi:hypothetical protein
MSITKTNARTMVRQFIDDPDAARWTDGNLDLLITLTLDDLWGELLDFAPMALSQLDELTSFTSPGYIDLRLTGSGGDLSQRFYRVQSVVRNTRAYTEMRHHDVLLEDNDVQASNVGTNYHYIVQADRIHLFPYSTTDAVELRYSFLPPEFTSLAGGDTVIWPDGYDAAFLHESAARALIKGDVEDPGQHRLVAHNIMERCREAISRNSAGPTTMLLTSHPHEWGSD